MGPAHLKDVLGRLAGVDLGGYNDDDDNGNGDGGAPLDLLDFGVGESPAGPTPTPTSSYFGDISSNISPSRTLRPARAAAPTIGFVTIGSEPSNSDRHVGTVTTTPSEHGSAQFLVLSNVPTTLDVHFSPTPSPPQYGLIVEDVGVERGGGFVGVTFVNCRFSEVEPTIFRNCSLNNTTFKNCDFRSVLLENVVMIGDTFLHCTFENCCWKNRKLAEQYPFRYSRFRDTQINDTEPEEIVALNLAREAAVKARLDAPSPPREKHASGLGKPRGWHSLEDDYKQYEPVQPIEFSNEGFSIPPSIGSGVVFDNTPRAGLTITAGHGFRFEGVQFTGSRFTRTVMHNCHFVNVTFEDCIFENASFTEVVIMNRAYKNVWFHGCSWSRRVLTKPAVHQNETFRQGGENPRVFPAIMSNHVAKLAEQHAWQETKEKREAKAVIKRPLSKYQQKLTRRDFSTLTPTEAEREQLAPGEQLSVYVKPGALHGVRNQDKGTTFVTPSFD